MAFVINVIKWLLWTVETMYFDVVEPVFYIYSNKESIGSISWATVLISSHPALCAKHNVACRHSQQTRDVDLMLIQFWPPSATLAQHRTSTGSTSRVRWAVDLAVHTVDGEYKPTPTQCLLNVSMQPWSVLHAL